MYKQILRDLYQIEIPLPRNPLKALNSYVIKGEGHFLIIDTGMNRQECLSEMYTGLEGLNVDLKKTDFFITHLHADHLGLTAKLATETSKVYFSQVEASRVNDISAKEKEWEKIAEVYLSNGFPADELKISAASHPGRRFGLKQHLDFCTVREGDRIEIGDYSFKCIETPGHSPGHMCLYEANKKILVAGDHILFDITPNITYWVNMENPLKQYLSSLDKVHTLDVDLVLPGHRRIMNDHRGRIMELKEHHQDRLKEVLLALEHGGKTAFEVAPYITWDIECKSWELFPAQQKWFAFGETLAHLLYLEQEMMVRKEMKEGKILFSLA
jgi:glyoxylase-like metal-dependent hydrolase (beta-lactamase superfamily II)